MLPDEVDVLLNQLAASLTRSRHDAFLDAARTALAGIPCLGEGLAYRILVPIQHRFFDAPLDTRVAAGPRHHRPNKLNTKPAIGAEDPRATGRARALWEQR
jgi:hypothetical protein